MTSGAVFGPPPILFVLRRNATATVRCASSSVYDPAMMGRPARRLLILGWDAADWIVLRALLDRGAMPTLARVIRSGVTGDLSTLEPKLSPLLWTSVATGRTADRHGILNFVEPEPSGAGLRLSSSTSRRTRALWNMCTQAGLTCNVVSWYATHPAEPVRGVVVSNLLMEGAPASARAGWPLPPGCVHPAERAEEIASRRVHPAAVSAKVLLELVPQMGRLGRDHPTVELLARLIAQCLSVHQVACHLLATGDRWDCTMIFQEAIDTVGHHFMQYRAPRPAHVSPEDHRLFGGVMDAIYRLHDRMLGELLRAAGDDVTLMLLSDHGFHSGDERPVTATMTPEQRAATEAAWHRSEGILVVHGPGIAPGGTVRGATLLDIAPTALTLLGLPVGQDMDGRVLTEAIDQAASVRTIPTWEDAEGDAGMHPADLRQDPFEAHDAIRQLIDLGYMADLPEDRQEQIELVRRETEFNRAVSLLHRGRAADAAQIMEPLVAGHPGESRYVLVLARALMMAGRPLDCAAEATRLLARAPGNAEALLLRAAARAQAGDGAASDADLDAIPRREADRPAIALAIADVRAVRGQWDEAARMYRKAIGHPATAGPAHVGMARVALARAAWERAAEHCLDAMEQRFRLPEAHFLLGVALAWMEEPAQAAQSLEMLLRLEPGWIMAHRFLAAIAREQGDMDRAGAHEARVAHLSAASSIEPDARETLMPATDAAQWAARHAAGTPGRAS